MTEYTLDFSENWDDNLKHFDNAVQLRIMKKISHLRGGLKSRHLKHGLPFFVEEVSGYRIVFELVEREKCKRILFIGNHKQYEKWYSEFR